MNLRLLTTIFAAAAVLLGCIFVFEQSASAQPPLIHAHSAAAQVGAQSRPDGITYPVQEDFEAGDLNVSAFHSAVPTCVPGNCGWYAQYGSGYASIYAAFAPEMNNVSDQSLVSNNAIVIPS